MTDFHTHVLPGMDDGAANVAVASQMLHSAKEQGVTTVLATSHFYGKTRSLDEFLEERAKAFAALQPSIPEGMTIRLGAEVYFSERAVLSAESLQSLCIEGTPYVLIELPFVRQWEDSLYRKIADLISMTGLTPILAHVDRYEAFFRDPQLLQKFWELGCLFQINASAFLDKRIKNFALALLKKGYVHCIGTDMHNANSRGCNIQRAKEVAREANLGEEWAYAEENMRILLDGESLQVATPAPIKRLFGKFR